jgi:hypothetical protein
VVLAGYHRRHFLGGARFVKALGESFCYGQSFIASGTV